MTTACDSGFFRRGMQISCAIHIFFIALVGMTIFAAQKEESAKEEYIFVNVEEQGNTAAGAPGRTAPDTQAAAAFRPQAAQPGMSAAHPLPAGRHAAVSRAAAAGESGFSASAPGERAGGEAVEASGMAAGVYAEESEAETGGGAVDVAGIAARFAGIVESRKEYPYMALKRGETGRVSVLVRLNADGVLAAAEVVGTSGIKSLDAGAVKAVRNSCPYAHGAGEVVEFVVPIVYELNGR